MGLLKPLLANVAEVCLLLLLLMCLDEKLRERGTNPQMLLLLMCLDEELRERGTKPQISVIETSRSRSNVRCEIIDLGLRLGFLCL